MKIRTPINKGKTIVAGIPNTFLRYFLKHKKLFIAAIFAVLLLLFTGLELDEAIITITLTAIASFSTIYKKYLKFTIGFELVTFATVLTTLKYGLPIGAVVGFVSALAAEVIPQLIDPSSFFWILSLPASAFAVSFFHNLGVNSLLWLGLISLAVQFTISEP
ncbi:hypothetical protein HY640_00375, partial [Candidatus Woesearchaeota archaeon]|nr:hypothetical protein [Candidatus Woesearchaeota archaeon]